MNTALLLGVAILAAQVAPGKRAADVLFSSQPLAVERRILAAPQPIRSVEFLGDNILCAAFGDTIDCWERPKYDRWPMIEQGAADFQSLTVSHHGHRYITFQLSNDRALVYDKTTKQNAPVKLLAPVAAVAVSPDESKVVSAEGGTLIVRSLADGSTLREAPLPANDGRPRSIAFVPSGAQFLLRTDTRATVYTTATLAPVATLPHTQLLAVDATLAGEPLTVRTDDLAGITKWDPKTFERIEQGRLGYDPLYWQRQQWKPLAVKPFEATPDIVRYVPKLDVLLLASGRILDAWNVRGPNPATWGPMGDPQLQHSDAITAVAVSCSGRWVATGSRDGTIVVWTLAAVPATPRVNPPDRASLERQLADATALRTDLQAKHTELRSMLQTFTSERLALTQQIRAVQARTKAVSYDDVLRTPELRQLLQQFQKKRAYELALAETANAVEGGINELTARINETRDDLRVLAVLPPEQLRALAGRIDDTIQRYDAKRRMSILPAQIQLPSEQQAWQELAVSP